MMTRQDFEKVAAVFRAHPAINSAEVKTLGFNLADQFALINPRFDRARFLAAAGIYKEDGPFTLDFVEDRAFSDTTGA